MYNAFSQIANNILNKWPIIRVKDMEKYSMANMYADEYPYVWFVNENYKVSDEFPWGWRPPTDEMFKIHEFPRVAARTRAPQRWDMVKLVPTNPYKRLDKKIVRQPIIASFNTNRYQTFSYAFGDRAAPLKLEKQQEVWPELKLIKGTKGYTEMYSEVQRQALSKYVWLFDADFRFAKGFGEQAGWDLDFEPEDNNKVYVFNTQTTAHSIVYPTGAAMLMPRKLLVKGWTEADVQVVDELAGVINETTDPYRAWTRAFYRTVKYKTTDVPYVDTDAIIEATLNANVGNLKNYVQKGTQAGLDFKGTLEDIDNADVLKEMFRSHR